MQVTVSMLVYSLMYTVDALVVFDAPESTLINTEVKNTNKIMVSVSQWDYSFPWK